MNIKMNMFKVAKHFFVICIILFSTISLAQNGKKHVDAKTKANTNNTTSTANVSDAYTEEKPDISITLDHPEFTIKLKSNPTTGYNWFLREYDSNVITPVKHYYQPSESKTKLIGAPGFEIWTFKAKPTAFNVPLISSIRFIYTRPWKSSDSSTQVVFHITTQGK